LFQEDIFQIPNQEMVNTGRDKLEIRRKDIYYLKRNVMNLTCEKDIRDG
jgi:hypothetical protein